MRTNNERVGTCRIPDSGALVRCAGYTRSDNRGITHCGVSRGGIVWGSEAILSHFHWNDAVIPSFSQTGHLPTASLPPYSHPIQQLQSPNSAPLSY